MRPVNLCPVVLTLFLMLSVLGSLPPAAQNYDSPNLSLVGKNEMVVLHNPFFTLDRPAQLEQTTTVRPDGTIQLIKMKVIFPEGTPTVTRGDTVMVTGKIHAPVQGGHGGGFLGSAPILLVLTKKFQMELSENQQFPEEFKTPS